MRETAALQPAIRTAAQDSPSFKTPCPCVCHKTRLLGMCLCCTDAGKGIFAKPSEEHSKSVQAMQKFLKGKS